MRLTIFFIAASLVGVPIVTGKEPLKVEVFYESYCPGCIYLIKNHVYKAWNLFKGRVLFDLVIYGKKESYTPHYEYLANKLHVCAVYQACGDTGSSGCAVDKLGPVMDFIYCLVRQPDQSAAAPQCAKDAGVDYDGIMNCSNGHHVDTILNRYWDRIDSHHIGYFPDVLIDGVHDKDAEEDLVKEICKLRPNLCSGSHPVGEERD